MRSVKIGAVVVTLNAERDLPFCIPPLVGCAAVDRVLVVDSSSQDGTVACAKRLGADVYSIEREAFNHGATRELARKLIGTDIVLMVTQDAYAHATSDVERLVAPILQGVADVSYGRQVPRVGADVFERFPREFNYPPCGNIRGIDDIQRFGVYTFFCSNSFAAYRQVALDAVGGFQHVLTNEDYFAAAAILENGGRIAYVANARVFHSHRYSLPAEFRRYFDTGYVRGERRSLRKLVGRAESRGAQMTLLLLKEVMRECPHRVPYALIHTAVKWIGYRIGYSSVKAPVWWKRALSGHRYYWNNRTTSAYAYSNKT